MTCVDMCARRVVSLCACISTFGEVAVTAREIKFFSTTNIGKHTQELMFNVLLISKEEIHLYWLHSERNLHSFYFLCSLSSPENNESKRLLLLEGIMRISDHVSGGMVYWKDINPTSQFVSLRTEAKLYELVQILFSFASLSY